MNDILSIQEIVQAAFVRAEREPTIARWKSVSLMAGCAAVRMAAEGDHYLAACLEGVADEARRQLFQIQEAA